jgi:pentatricopeptide repeat protein
MEERDMISWTLMLGGYTKKGLSKEGFELYEQSQVAGVRCDRIMYVSIVSICASLGDVRKGKAVHTDIKKAGIATDVILESNLVHMYAKCGSMKLAHEVFDKMVERNVVSWNAMIAGSAQNGDTEEAFELFQQMQHENVKPDRITFTSLLGACDSPEALKLGHWVHAKIIKAGLEADVHIGTSLVSMFAKCGSTQDARKVFDKMVVRNVVSWNAMINGYAEHGQCDDAIEVFHLMQHKGFKPNSGTILASSRHVPNTHQCKKLDGLLPEAYRLHWGQTSNKDSGYMPILSKLDWRQISELGMHSSTCLSSAVAYRMPREFLTKWRFGMSSHGLR